MSNYRNSTVKLSSIFAVFVALTIAVWVLRGFEVITFIPSGVIWVLILLSIITGVLTYLQNNVW